MLSIYVVTSDNEGTSLGIVFHNRDFAFLSWLMEHLINADVYVTFADAEFPAELAGVGDWISGDLEDATSE